MLSKNILLNQKNIKNNGSPNIIHLDDDEDFLLLFAMKYRKWFNITSANNSHTAFELIKSGSFDAVVIDQEMPQIN